MELGNDFYWFILIGLAAQLVDGALGMAFGLVSTSVLLAMGLPPASISAAVHTAKVFTTGASGGSHALMGNVDRILLLRLAVPGVIGGVIGAYALTRVPGNLFRPVTCIYLLVLAALILRRVGRHRPPEVVSTASHQRQVPAVGFFAGLLDAIGGGGWGSLSTATLLASGSKARATIGTVSLAEFAVTLAISLTFVFTVRMEYARIVAGLVIGGVLAAPVAALLVKRLPERIILGSVGVLALVVSAYQLVLFNA
ncbi:sulfite exporter TauE/SafE family protein [Pseudoxanthomonas sp.]|uniref:sulfite exporter TauE/SafE family protein n=1 Tax=Pseudoxanthomonas sp. TaxID=1871049 RepID=UPI00262A02F6|nr:sulfite exporter TauE/SafE family protein [Pseudoxanthomonas sp.]WDS35614.1 MAG: sulfite exporter TauE/SafE family protein [Pseudoxanthomonas sp.]